MPRDERARRNMELFRDVNERISSFEADWLSREPIAFVCECAELGCRAPVYLTVDEFRKVRSMPGHFVTLPEHVHYQDEDVVMSAGRYAVVAEIEADVPSRST